MDAPAHRLFVTHGTRVQVVDVKTDSVVGEIPDAPGVHGVALAHDLDRGFTSNGRDSSVTVFDLKTLAVRMYANLEDSSAVVAFDTRTLKVLGRWPLAPGEGPSGLAMDREHRRVFAGCSNQKLVVLDADGGRVVSVLPIGKNVDGVAFDSARQLVFSSNGDGTLTVIHEDGPDRYTVLENAPTQGGARTLALDETSGRVYVPTADFGPPPPPTADRPHPRPSVKPGTFVVLVVNE